MSVSRIPSAIRSTAYLILMLLALAWLGSGGAAVRAAQEPAVTTGGFVGAFAGTDAFIGIATNEQDIQVFVCDGTEQGVSLWGWFQGSVVAGQADLTSPNGLRLMLDMTGASPVGFLITSDGARLDAVTEAAIGDAGIWRGTATADGGDIVAGWVVLNDGQQRGGFAVSDGSVRFAPPLDLRTPVTEILGRLVIAKKLA